MCGTEYFSKLVFSKIRIRYPDLGKAYCFTFKYYYNKYIASK